MFKLAVQENFVKFKRKHLCWTPFTNRVADSTPAALLKKTMAQVFPLTCSENLENLFMEQLRITPFKYQKN